MAAPGAHAQDYAGSCSCAETATFTGEDYKGDEQEFGYCSRISCSSSPPSKVSCFPAAAAATLADGRRVPVSALAVGDAVLADASGGVSPVLTVLHARAGPAEFVVASLGAAADEREFAASPTHLVATRHGFAFAAELSPGDALQAAGGAWRNVTAVRREWREGAFAPVTAAGTLVVDGVVASCYAEIRWHAWAHALFAPLRWAHGWWGAGALTLAGGAEPHAVWTALLGASKWALPASAWVGS